MLRRDQKVVIAVLLAILVTTLARAQCPGQWLTGMGIPGISGWVTAMTSWDPDGAGPRPSLLVASGSFTIAGSATVRNIAAWDGATWTALGSNLVSAEQGPRALATYNGELIAAGSFLTPANPTDYQAVMRWDGTTWSPLGGLVSGAAYSLVVWNDLLVVAGRFRTATFGSGFDQIIASWNGSAWAPLTTFGMMQGGSNVTISLYNGDLVAAALFNGGQNPRVLRRTVAGWVELASQPAFVPTVLTTFQGDLIAAGTAGALQQVARWNGTSWTTMSSVVTDPVTALCASNGQLFALRQYSRALYRWNGAAWEIAGTVDPGGSASLTCLAADDHALYAGGQFAIAQQIPVRNIVRFDGSAWSPLGTGINAPPVAMIDDGNGGAVVGGSFTAIGSVSTNAAARLTPAGWESLSLASAYDSVRALTMFNGDVIAAGDLGVNSQLIEVARWDGSHWQPVGSGIDGANTIGALAVYNNELYAAGDIDASVAGSPNIVRWNGSEWTAAGLGISTFVRTLRVFDGRLIAGITSGGVPGGGSLVAWNGASWAPYGGGVGTSGGQFISALGEWNGKLVAGGSFNVPGRGTATIAAWNSATSTWTVLATTGTVTSFAALRGDLYAGGTFTSLGGTTVANVARWDGAWHGLGQGLDGFVNVLLASDDRLLAAGVFGQAGGRFSPMLATWVFPSSDFNHDGDSATDADIEAFFACLAGDCCATCSSSDFDGDGDVGTDADIEAFFRVLAGGAC